MHCEEDKSLVNGEFQSLIGRFGTRRFELVTKESMVSIPYRKVRYPAADHCPCREHGVSIPYRKVRYKVTPDTVLDVKVSIPYRKVRYEVRKIEQYLTL